MTNPLVTLPPVPVQTVFGAQKGETQSGISRYWIKWFQQFQQSVVDQVAAITGLTITTVTQATLPNTLLPKDAGLIYFVSDYNHLLQWNGTNYVWAPGENGSGYISPFLVSPTGAGWHLCDGSTINRLNSDGTITSVVLPNYTTAAYLKLGTIASAGPNAASGATTAVTAGTPAGTFTGASDTTSSVSAGTPSGTFTGASDTTSVESADVLVQAGTADTNVAAANHTHTVTPTGTFAGNALAGHTHTVTPTGTFAGAALGTHSHGPGTLELDNTVLLAYYRQ